MSGPVEITGLLFVAIGAVCFAVFVVPIPKKPEPDPKPTPPAYERLSDTAPVSQAVPVIAPVPHPPLDSEDHRIMILEESVSEIKRDQHQLKNEIRALTKELKAK
jgi:hypothetical protein